MAPSDRTRSDPRGDDDARERLIEVLFSRYVDRLNAGEALDREEIYDAHPDLADELFERLRDYEDLGCEAADDGILGVVGDYQLLRPIGRGGMGIVYEAWENSMDRRVALKVLPPGIAADARTFTRFVREARVAGRLQHSNIVSVYGMGIREETPYYAMEFVEGETLAQRLARMRAADGGGEAIEHASWATAFAGVAEGLSYAHRR
ncbi:MAG: protein kinase, partial [Planctomycetes bacterium]|nr:protein kinase [Planctomycetota bacterium]